MDSPSPQCPKGKENELYNSVPERSGTSQNLSLINKIALPQSIKFRNSGSNNVMRQRAIKHCERLLSTGEGVSTCQLSDKDSHSCTFLCFTLGHHSTKSVSQIAPSGKQHMGWILMGGQLSIEKHKHGNCQPLVLIPEQTNLAHVFSNSGMPALKVEDSLQGTAPCLTTR